MTSTMFKLRSGESVFSRLTIILSSICIVHCLSMPLLILALPALATFLSATLELILVLAIIPLSLISFIPGWLKHRNYNRFYLFSGGILLIILTQLFLHSGHNYSTYDPAEWIGLIGLFCGVIMVSAAVYLQNQHSHVCSNPHHQH